MKTLESLTEQLRKQKMTDVALEKNLHRASVLAMVSAAYEVVSRECMPTPLYRLSYDNTAHNLKFESLDGRAVVPKQGTLEISMLDTLLASLLRERMPILWEGKTGIGKTFTTEKFARALFPADAYRILRLNQHMSNVQQPYVEGRIENGVVTIRLRKEELDRIAFLFIDEVNRGDSNQVLQMQDGRIILSTGERGELGIPLPEFNGGKWTINGDEKKPLHVVSAQNPSSTSDARYTGTKKTDAAMANRNLTMYIPNSAATIGASALMLADDNGQHPRFLTAYRTQLERFLGVKVDPAQLQTDWISMYAFTGDSRRTGHPMLRSASEFLDGLLLFTSRDLPQEYQRERATADAWTDQLRPYKVDFKYGSDLTAKSAALDKVNEIVQSFGEEVITRDITKVRKLADAVSMIRGYKSAFQDADPLKAYTTAPDFVTVEDIACASAIMLRDKQEKHDIDSTTLVDQVLRDYVSIGEHFAQGVKYGKPFAANDVDHSVYNLALQHAVKETMGSKSPVEKLIQDLGASAIILKKAEQGSETRKPLIARMVADLATVAGFTHQYRGSLDAKFAAEPDLGGRRRVFLEFYKQMKGGVATPDIYLQRLPRVFGA